jgi:hypothetical protein
LTPIPSDDFDAGRFEPKRSAPTDLPTPVASTERGRRLPICRRRSLRGPACGCGAVGTNKSAKRSLPDRAWRFGPTEALSGRGDNTLPAPVNLGTRVGRSNRHPRSGSRIRRHRWLQADELPTPVASTQAVGTDEGCQTAPVDSANVRFRPGKNFRDQRPKTSC